VVIDVAPEPAVGLVSTAPEDKPEAVVPRTWPPKPGLVAIALGVVLVVCAATLFFVAFVFGLSGLQEQRSQHELYAQFRGLVDPASPVAPSIGGVIPAGTPVALLNSPQAGWHDVAVVEGTSSSDLLAGPGHLADTPLPGQPGESVLVGKSATAGAPFADIVRLRKGDVVTVRTGQGNFHFTVQGRLAAGQHPPTITTRDGLLTLVTSAGSTSLGSVAASHLIYVVAKLDGTVVPAPPHGPTSVPADQVQGQNDPGAWPFVALWSAALLAASAACWWMWWRWRMIQTWMIGAPVILAILWGLSNEAMRLLPNVY